MPIKDKHYFIEFVNYTIEDIKRIYDEFPKEIVDKPENWPILDAPIETNLHSLVVATRSNGRPIPERMVLFAKSFHQSLKNILNNIILTQGQLNESNELNFIIDLQQRMITKYEYMDGRLIEKIIPNHDDMGKVMITPGWLMFSCRSLLDFLCEGNLNKLKKCPDCRKFYIQKKLYGRQKYCAVCSKKNHTPKEIQAKRTHQSRAAAKKRKDKESRKVLFEKQYKRHIEAGFSKKEAKERATDFVIEQLGEIE
jgi:hypothetical protein